MTCIIVMGNALYLQTFLFRERYVNGCFVFRFLNEKNISRLNVFVFLSSKPLSHLRFLLKYIPTLVWTLNVLMMVMILMSGTSKSLFMIWSAYSEWQITMKTDNYLMWHIHLLDCVFWKLLDELCWYCDFASFILSPVDKIYFLMEIHSKKSAVSKRKYHT